MPKPYDPFVGYKKCSACKQSKPIESFMLKFTREGAALLSPMCNTCMALRHEREASAQVQHSKNYYKTYYETHKEQRRLKTYDRKRLEREWLIETGQIVIKPKPNKQPYRTTNVWRAEYYRTHIEYSADKSLQRRRGITLEDKKRMYSEQDGKCAICGGEITLLGKIGAHVDHDHETGQIRNLLCFKCNHLLGDASDNSVILEKAIQYLNCWNI